MHSNDSALARPLIQTVPDTVYTALETQLLEAVADFSVEELSQMLDVATALRRTRRL